LRLPTLIKEHDDAAAAAAAAADDDDEHFSLTVALTCLTQGEQRLGETQRRLFTYRECWLPR